MPSAPAGTTPCSSAKANPTWRSKLGAVGIGPVGVADRGHRHVGPGQRGREEPDDGAVGLGLVGPQQGGPGQRHIAAVRLEAGAAGEDLSGRRPGAGVPQREDLAVHIPGGGGPGPRRDGEVGVARPGGRPHPAGGQVGQRRLREEPLEGGEVLVDHVLPGEARQREDEEAAGVAGRHRRRGHGGGRRCGGGRGRAAQRHQQQGAQEPAQAEPAEAGPQAASPGLQAAAAELVEATQGWHAIDDAAEGHDLGDQGEEQEHDGHRGADPGLVLSTVPTPRAAPRALAPVSPSMDRSRRSPGSRPRAAPATTASAIPMAEVPAARATGT